MQGPGRADTVNAGAFFLTLDVLSLMARSIQTTSSELRSSWTHPQPVTGQ
ncbi:unnamed protein product [Staurois parvus]|uniref:Uncharacterized protein n=1 Tax=Staurois parvus TaxID=386267 RepID=A0ABN9ADK0_9NEOB|nr:unnamed protein product [Staurois parvus]